MADDISPSVWVWGGDRPWAPPWKQESIKDTTTQLITEKIA